MPDVKDGIETGALEATDPFVAAMEEKGIKGGGGSGASLRVSDGLSFGSKEAPADTVDTAAEVIDDEEEAESDEVPLHEDPDIAAYLSRFDGDADKALKAAVEAQKMIGRQGNELGDMKRDLAEMKGRLDQAAVTPAVPTPPVSWQNLTKTDIEDALLDNDPSAFITNAINTGAPDAQIERMFSTWGEDDQYSALALRQNWLMWKAQEAAVPAKPEKVEPSVTDTYVQQKLEAERMDAAMVEVAKDYTDVDTFNKYLTAALEASPRIVQKGVLSLDDTEQKEALHFVFDRARAIAAADATRKTDADTTKKGAAKVITGSGGTPPAPNQNLSDAAEKRKNEEATLKRMLLEDSSTSVHNGLTYGKA